MTSKKKKDTTQVTIRLENELIRRIEKLARLPDKVKNPMFSFRFSTNDAIRALLLAAVERAEEARGEKAKEATGS